MADITTTLIHTYKAKICDAWDCKRAYFVEASQINNVNCPYCASKFQRMREEAITKLHNRIRGFKGVITKLKKVGWVQFSPRPTVRQKG